MCWKHDDGSKCRCEMMQLLVKGSGMAGLAKHIADAKGAPLCGNNLKLADWHIEEHSAPTGVICAQCRRIYAASYHNSARAR
jgi:hypothetical protein